MNIQLSGNSSGGQSCSQHANCMIPQNLRLLWHCVVWQNGTLWAFIVPSTSALIMLFNQLLTTIHLSGGRIVLPKEKCSLTWMKTNLCPTFERNKLFVCMENVWDLLFQLIKNGTNTLHVAFLFLFSVYWVCRPLLSIVWFFCSLAVRSIPWSCSELKGSLSLGRKTAV
jgi:hypothetical protein